MNLQEQINRVKQMMGVINEEMKIPEFIRRRFNFDDKKIIIEMKKNALYLTFNYPKMWVEKATKLSAGYTFWELMPDIDLDDIDEETTDKYGQIMSEYFFKLYGQEVMDYLVEIYNSQDQESDGFKYIFIKHSERYGGNGFSEGFETWFKLLSKFGSWFPFDWSSIKTKLDKMTKGGEILISSPNDEHNTMGYYFSVKKRPLT
jgi:hypothetical protein